MGGSRDDARGTGIAIRTGRWAERRRKELPQKSGDELARARLTVAIGVGVVLMSFAVFGVILQVYHYPAWSDPLGRIVMRWNSEVLGLLAVPILGVSIGVVGIVRGVVSILRGKPVNPLLLRILFGTSVVLLLVVPLAEFVLQVDTHV